MSVDVLPGDREAQAEMRAVVVRQPGGPEQLEIGHVPVPRLEPGCIEIEVRASALNRADLLQRRGLYPPPKGASEILGLECAGVVRAVADGVNGFRPGERVMALLAGGGYAERAVVPQGHVMRIPSGLSFEQAAAIPEAFLTASEALFATGELEAGGWVLIHAAAGGVGSAAVQLARRVGAHVIACAGAGDKVDWIRKLGADVALNHREQDFEAACLEHTAGRGVDVVLDFVGASHAERHQRCLAEAGRWVVLGMLGGNDAKIDLARVLRRRLRIAGLVMRSRSSADKAAIVARFSERFSSDLEAGTLSPQIDRVYPLSQVRAAHERMEKNENLGKIVLGVSLE
jgi:putative PIG3 family NAD(P)H quinone oxidoreductase